jgi:phage-related protein
VPTQAVFYRDEKGREPAKEFLWQRLPLKARGHVEDQIEELNGLSDSSPPPPFPLTSKVAGGLRELRCHSGSSLYRILYRRSGNLLILLHTFHKDSRAIPRRDVELAQRRWRDFKRRMDTPERRGPRPAGEDAP